MKRIATILSLGAFLSVSCEKGVQNNDNCVGNIDLKIGETTEIKSGETACNVQYGLSLRVISVNDGRCPEGVDCMRIEGVSEASVEFQLTTKKGKYNFTLDTYQGGAFTNDTIIEDIKYQLRDILPYPMSFGEEQAIKTVRIWIGNEEDSWINCDQDVIISETEYEKAPSRPVEIIDMKIEGSCLNIKFSCSLGCGEDTWKLIDSGDVAHGVSGMYPPLPSKRTLRLSPVITRTCLVPIISTHEKSYNIENLQVQGNRRIQLNILDKSILYEY